MTPPLRVLHVHSGNLYGGVESILVTIARHAAATPDIQWRHALGWEGRLSAELAAAGANTAIIGAARFSRPWTAWAARGQLQRLLAREPCDVAMVHSTWSLAMFGPVLYGAKTPVVWWLHSPQRGPGWLERRAARSKPARAVANSRFTGQHLPPAFAGIPVDVVYPPVAEPAAATDRDGLRRALGVEADQALILHVGRMEAWKGQLVLLEALRGVDERGWVCGFVGAAQRPEELAFQQEIGALAARFGLAERVRMLGERSDVPALLAAADIVALPSTEPEGFGMALLEALYCERAVVVTAIGATPEIVDSSCALLIRPGEAPTLTRALSELLTDPARRAELGARGRTRAVELCDPPAQLAKLGQVLRRAACG